MENNKTGTVSQEKFRLDSLTVYQESSVISRVIIKKNNGNVTAFSFDKNEGLSEHTAPFDALVYIIEGKAEISISGMKHELSDGEAIIMPAGLPHSLKALSRFKMILVMIKDR